MTFDHMYMYVYMYTQTSSEVKQVGKKASMLVSQEAIRPVKRATVKASLQVNKFLSKHENEN